MRGEEPVDLPAGDDGPGEAGGPGESGESEPPGPGGPPRSEGRGTLAVDPDRPCMNCGNPARGEYCPSCGQRKVDVRVSVRALIMDVLEDQFILDKRLPRTLGNLFFRPGRLTVEHINGRIVRYIHPFRLYLVSSLVFFLVLSFLSLQLVRRALDDDEAAAVVATTDRAAELDASIAELEESLSDTTLTGEARATLQTEIDELTSRRQALRADSLAAAVASLDSAIIALDRALADSATPGTVRGALEVNRSTLQRRRDVAVTQQQGLAEAGDTVVADTDSRDTDQPVLRAVFGWDENPPTVNPPGPPAVDSALANQIRRLGDMTPRQAAETITATFFDYVPIMMFVLLPVFAGVLKLLYIRRRRYYAEHFVFLLHVHSFVFFLLTIMLLLRGRTGQWVEPVLGFWLIAYIYIAMMRVYGQGWIKTFVKYWTLGWMYFWILLTSTGIVFVAALLLF